MPPKGFDQSLCPEGGRGRSCPQRHVLSNLFPEGGGDSTHWKCVKLA